MSFVKTYEDILEHATESTDFYAAEMLPLVWETTPGAIEKLLPPPLNPASMPGVVAEVVPIEFAPYAFLKWEWAKS